MRGTKSVMLVVLILICGTIIGSLLPVPGFRKKNPDLIEQYSGFLNFSLDLKNRTLILPDTTIDWPVDPDTKCWVILTKSIAKKDIPYGENITVPHKKVVLDSTNFIHFSRYSIGTD